MSNDEIFIQLQHSRQDLQEFIDQSSKQLVEDDINVAHYFECFRTLSNPLISYGYVSEKECNKLFFQGFHPDTHCLLRRHIIDMRRKLRPGANFDFQDLFDIAHTFFRRIRLAVEAKATRQKLAQEGEDWELKQLISGMWDLSIHDPTYAVLYRQCAHHFPKALQGVPKPEPMQDAAPWRTLGLWGICTCRYEGIR